MGKLAELGWRATSRLVNVAPALDLPTGKMLELPGRGSTYVVDTGLPPVEGADRRPTLVLLHALACTGLLTWYPSIAALRARHRLVIFDQRWHGRGIRSPQFLLEDCADDAVAVADALGLGTFVPVGYSMGSLVAQLAWRQHPRRVAGAVFAASATSFAPTYRDPRRLRAMAGGLTTLIERRYRPTAVREVVETVFADDNRWAWDQFRSTTPREIAAATGVIGRFDSSPWISAMDVPTSVVVTTRDRAILPARQRRLARLLPNSTVYEVAGGHASCVMNAAAFTPALLAACASVSARIARRAPR